jgi:hypothetical protein
MEVSVANEHRRYPPHRNLLERYQRLGQLCEILAVIALAVAILVGMVDYHNPWWKVLAVFPLLGFGGALWAALKFGVAAEKQGRRVARRTRYIVSERRLKTLEIVLAPMDAVEALRTIPVDRRMTEEQLVSSLVQELGSERTNEIKGIILKYTREDKKDRAGYLHDRLPR